MTARRLLPLVALTLSLVVACPLVACAQISVGTPSGADSLEQTRAKFNFPDAFGNRSVPEIIGGIIKTALPLVGSLFLLMFLYGGFLYMTAGGNDKRVEEGRQTLTNAAIGMAIVIGAYALVNYVISSLMAAMTG